MDPAAADPTWPAVAGVVVAGHGVASGAGDDARYPEGTLTLQFPHFAARGLDLSGFHPGTLNVDIAPFRFRLVRPARTFRRVEWTQLHPPEDFSFSRCRLLHAGREVAAWIYTPHPETKADHFQPPTMLEILAPFVSGIRCGDRVELRLAPGEIALLSE